MVRYKIMWYFITIKNPLELNNLIEYIHSLPLPTHEFVTLEVYIVKSRLCSERNTQLPTRKYVNSQGNLFPLYQWIIKRSVSEYMYSENDTQLLDILISEVLKTWYAKSWSFFCPLIIHSEQEKRLLAYRVSYWKM